LKEIEFLPVKTELMRSSSAANGDENDKDVLDDGEECCEICFFYMLSSIGRIPKKQTKLIYSQTCPCGHLY